MSYQDLKRSGQEALVYSHLREHLHLPVADVHLKLSGAGIAYLVIGLRKQQHPAQPKQVMWGAWSGFPTLGKITVVVDEDIDVRDSFAVDWALSFRFQPARDVVWAQGLSMLAAHSAIIGPEGSGAPEPPLVVSKVGLDATRKHEFPARSYPPAEHMALVTKEWARYGLD